MNSLCLNLLRDIEEKPTRLQELQREQLDLLRRARDEDEPTAVAFMDFVLALAAREAMRRVSWR